MSDFIDTFSHLTNAASWPAAQAARAAWLAVHNDPSATAEAKEQAKSAFTKSMRACLAEVGALPRAR